MRHLPILLLALALGACSLSGPRPAQTTYSLEAAPAAPLVTTPLWPGALVVRDMEVPTFYLSPSLSFSREAGTRAHYQYARYTDPVGSAITDQVVTRLHQSGLFRGVAPLGQGVTGAWQLNLRLIDCYHDLSAAPGTLRLSFEADLVRRDTAQLLARTRIDASAPAASLDAKGAAAASNQALTHALTQLALWLKAEAR